MIRPYQENDFPFLEKWITDPFLLFQFAGPSWEFPITPEQIVRHQRLFPNKQLYVGLDENHQPIAFGEIIHGEIHSPRLGRLLVGDPNLRGRGIGRNFILALIRECQRLFQPEEICLFVLTTNSKAYSLYRKIGFRDSGEKIPDMEWNGNSYPVLKMVLDLKNFE